MTTPDTIRAILASDAELARHYRVHHGIDQKWLDTLNAKTCQDEERSTLCAMILANVDDD